MIRALVVDDSAYNRVTLSRMLAAHPRIQVVGTAVNGEDAIKQVARQRPDVVILDLEMPVMDGFSFLRWLMANRPTAVIVVSSRSSDRSVFKALELGAFDFVGKPGGRVSKRLEEIADDLVAKVLQVAELRVDNLQRRVQDDEQSTVALPAGPAGIPPVDMVAIGCSTGGPPALQQIFQALPRLPVPFVVAQHMPPSFTRMFAERVNRFSNFDVAEAADGDLLLPGCVYVAPGGMQTEVERRDDALRLRVVHPGAADLYAPSVDRLFGSASDACGSRLLTVVLTGMGDDGAHSIRRVKERGAITIAEAEESAIIFGMPAAAIKTGAVDRVLPLRDIPPAIQQVCAAN